MYKVVDGKLNQIDGVFVVLSSLPSAKKSTVHLKDFTANYWYRRKVVQDSDAIESILLAGIKELYKPHVRVVTHQNWFDIRGGVPQGVKASRWFAQRFNLTLAPVTRCVIVQPGAPDM